MAVGACLAGTGTCVCVHTHTHTLSEQKQLKKPVKNLTEIHCETVMD